MPKNVLGHCVARLDGIQQAMNFILYRLCSGGPLKNPSWEWILFFKNLVRPSKIDMLEWSHMPHSLRLYDHFYDWGPFWFTQIPQYECTKTYSFHDMLTFMFLPSLKVLLQHWWGKVNTWKPLLFMYDPPRFVISIEETYWILKILSLSLSHKHSYLDLSA